MQRDLNEDWRKSDEISHPLSAEAVRGYMASGEHGNGYVESHMGEHVANYGVNSSTYPYLSTAVWHGQWALRHPVAEFREHLRRILEHYRVNISERGIF